MATMQNGFLVVVDREQNAFAVTTIAEGNDGGVAAAVDAQRKAGRDISCIAVEESEHAQITNWADLQGLTRVRADKILPNIAT